MLSDRFNFDGEVTVAATVATGLENVAASEVRDKIPCPSSSTGYAVVAKQGRVYMRTTKGSLAMVHKLRSVDRLFLIVKTCENYVYKESKEETFADLVKLAQDMNWSEIVQFWGYNKQYCKGKSRQENLSKKSNRAQVQKNNSTKYDLDSSIEASGDCKILADSISMPSSDCGTDETKHAKTDSISDSSVPLTAPDGTLVRFRVTSNRVGKKQPLTSPEASYKFGGEIQNVTNWKVDLSNYNLEIMLCLGESSLEVAVALTLQSLHRRNITHFGVTTLRATTAYCMLRLCNIQPGEIVIDPMCGSGAIPVESALEWPNNFHIGGDYTKAATMRCKSNIKFINDNPGFVGRDSAKQCEKRTMKLRADTIRWDVTALPIKTNSVDVVVSDLPFGKRMGSKVDNRKLYPALLKELARVTRCETGRACLLTQDKRTFKRAVDELPQLWKLKKTLHINIGGLTAGLFLLERMNNIFEDTHSS